VPASVHVIARFRAKAGNEAALKAVLSSLVAPTRRELGCYQYDLLESPTDAQEFCLVERWENEKALEQHTETEHVRKALAEAAPLTEEPPEGRRYILV
jgi:quinol monooxygenase YgiN